MSRGGVLVPRMARLAAGVTDTAFLRNPNYHRRTDTIETLDFARMAGVVKGLHGVLREADLR